VLVGLGKVFPTDPDLNHDISRHLLIRRLIPVTGWRCEETYSALQNVGGCSRAEPSWFTSSNVHLFRRLPPADLKTNAEEKPLY